VARQMMINLVIKGVADSKPEITDLSSDALYLTEVLGALTATAILAIVLK